MVPDADKSSDNGKAAQRDLCDQLKKNVFVVVDGENSSEAYNQFWNNVKSYKSTTFSETLAAVGKIALQIGDAINCKPCFLFDKSHSNKEDLPWAESKQGKYFRNLGYTNCPQDSYKSYWTLVLLQIIT